ncbi:G-protein coupled receptor 42-like [Tachyglossus aculeatus]|uniref:G-protein coupled receptor 42-like n=1 Tax=Tachyglossus aculeatus TaxID=9261 RepID=UPI0018F33346|nr:G-protein coupled receptor 42-like [Tachyglossus aculeatus]
MDAAGAGPGDPWGSHWLLFCIYLSTFLVGLPLNLTALVIFVARLRQRPAAVDILLLNLTLSDLLLLLFLPFRMVETASGLRWPLPPFLCSLSLFMFFTAIYLSTLLLAAVSVERLLGASHPVWYRTRRRSGQAVAVSALCWLLAGSHCSVVYITEYEAGAFSDANGTCYTHFAQEQLTILLPVRLEMAVVLFGLPLALSGYCYARLVCILSRGPCRRRTRKRVTGLVAATMLNFLVCFGPYNASHVVGYVQWASPTWRNYAFQLSTLNTCVDPLVFYFSSAGFQTSCRDLLARMRPRWCPRRGAGSNGEGPRQ